MSILRQFINSKGRLCLLLLVLLVAIFTLSLLVYIYVVAYGHYNGIKGTPVYHHLFPILIALSCMVVTALVGFMATSRRQRCYYYCCFPSYMILLIVILFYSILLVAVSRLVNIDGGDGIIGDMIEDFQFETFNLCCVPLGYGVEIEPCTDTPSSTVCLNSKYNSDALVNDHLCEILEGWTNLTEACSNGEVAEFQDVLDEFISEYTMPLSIVVLCYVVLLLCTAVLGSCAVCYLESANELEWRRRQTNASSATSPSSTVSSKEDRTSGRQPSLTSPPCNMLIIYIHQYNVFILKCIVKESTSSRLPFFSKPPPPPLPPRDSEELEHMEDLPRAVKKSKITTGRRDLPRIMPHRSERQYTDNKSESTTSLRSEDVHW